jgi:hypothetical protein
MIAAWTAESDTPKNGSAKYNQNSWTSEDVPRKNSTQPVVTILTIWYRECLKKPSKNAETAARAAEPINTSSVMTVPDKISHRPS